MEIKQKYYSITQAAKIAGFSRQHMYTLIDLHNVPVSKPSVRGTRIHVFDLEALMKKVVRR